MDYKIQTTNAAQKLATIISCVKKGKDQKGKGIDTWTLDSRSKQDYGILIHTDGQWKSKGYIECTLVANHTDVILVEFKYWSDCNDNIKSPDDEGIVLGRFTELLINHFADLNIKIEIEP